MDQLINHNAVSYQGLMNTLDQHALHANTAALTSPGLVIGTSSTAAVKIANTTVFKIGGLFYSKAGAEIAFTATAPSNIATGYEQCFMLTLDSSGNGLLVPGAPSLGAGTSVIPNYPGLNTGLNNLTACPIGYVRVLNTSGSAFTAGTTALSASGITVAYVNGYPSPLYSVAQ